MVHKIDEYFIIKNSNGNISWKKTAEKLFEQIKENGKYHKMGLKCPRCGKELMADRFESEIFCEDENCTFDKIVMEVMYDDFLRKYEIEEVK